MHIIGIVIAAIVISAGVVNVSMVIYSEVGATAPELPLPTSSSPGEEEPIPPVPPGPPGTCARYTPDPVISQYSEYVYPPSGSSSLPSHAVMTQVLCEHVPRECHRGRVRP